MKEKEKEPGPLPKEIKVHHCPLGIVLNPLWLKTVAVIGTLLGGLGTYAITQGISFASTTQEKLIKHEAILEALGKADLINKVADIGATQKVQVQAQERMEVKMDRMMENLAIPNPAPGPTSGIINTPTSSPVVAPSSNNLSPATAASSRELLSIVNHD